MTRGRVLVRRIAAPVLVGLAVGWGGFTLTSRHEPPSIGTVCIPSRAGGFSPWSGEPLIQVWGCTNLTSAPGSLPGQPVKMVATYSVVSRIPDDVVGRRAVPVPVGFALGFLLTPFLLRLWRVLGLPPPPFSGIRRAART
jgi:hypothetical protein